MRFLLSMCAAACLAACTGSASGAVDLFTPDMQRLKDEYLKAKAQADETHVNALQALLAKTNSKFEDMLADKKRSGNVTGMAVARTGLNLIKQAEDELKEKKTFTLPEKSRRELADIVSALAADKKALDDTYAASVKDLAGRYLPQLAELVRAQGEEAPDDEGLGALLDQLSGTARREEAPPADAPAAGTNAPPAAPAPPAVPDVLASSGEGDEWVSIARWEADVYGMEMLEVPIMDRGEAAEEEGFNPIVEKEFKARYTPIRVLAPGENYVFRIKSVPGKGGVELVDWPSRKNGWTFTLRVKPRAETPSQHMVELQVSFPGASTLPVIDGAETLEGVSGLVEDPAAPKVRVGVKTAPPGAYIFVDGMIARKGRTPHVTPAIIDVTEGTHSIKLKKFGFFDAIIENYEAREGLVIAATLRPDPAYVDKTVAVASRTAWQDSGIEVKTGDRLSLSATGKWACGSRREVVGPDGYPNNRQFFEYYLNPKLSPRQLAGKNYGGLIMRIGKDGKIVYIGNGAKLTADADGNLFFDINEADDGQSRRDNSGTISVRVQKAPAGRGGE